RALFAINLDVDEQAIHQLRRRLVFERLVGHHVAPVAGRVAYRQEHRLAACSRQVESFLAPGIPVDRVRRVLQQVGARLLCQPVAMLLPVLHWLLPGESPSHYNALQEPAMRASSLVRSNSLSMVSIPTAGAPPAGTSVASNTGNSPCEAPPGKGAACRPGAQPQAA